MLLKSYHYNFLSIFVGVILGYVCAETLLPAVHVMSAVVVRVMQCLAVPIIFFSLISTMLETDTHVRLGRLFRLTVMYTVGTTIVAALLGLVLYILIDPAKGVVASGGEAFTLKGSYVESLLKLIPSNIFDVFLTGNVIGAVGFAVLLGGVGRSLPQDLKDPFKKGMRLMTEVFLRLAGYVVRMLPLFLWAFALLFVQDLKEGFAVSGFAKYVVVVLGTNTAHAFLVLPLLLKIKGVSFLQTLKGATPALSIAALSKSSAVAIPTTLHVCVKNLRISEHTARFTVPVCATINMNGCAAFIFATTLFMVEIFQGVVSLDTMLLGVVVATLVAVGNAGVPMGCFFMTLSLLTGLGVPTHMMGMLIPFFAVLDMYETGINVWSDVVVSRCIHMDLQHKS